MSENIEKARQLIVDGIDDDLIALSEMRTLLLDERKALENQDIDSIQFIGQRKSELTDVLTLRANQRTEILSVFNLNNDETGIMELFESAPRTRIEQSWPELKSELIFCQEANEANRKLATRARHTIERILKIVQGKSDKANIYNPLGNTAAIISGNLIGEA